MSTDHPAHFRVTIKRWLSDLPFCVYIDLADADYVYDSDLDEDQAYEVATSAFAALLAGRPIDPRFQRIQLPF